ncbi:glycosyltransferase [Pelagibacterium halotolerans]|uniref:glycosyltransferase n=1 Tax=Pelagibacterium halotolerans TaxID=531813 RepID=UPI0038514380
MLYHDYFAIRGGGERLILTLAEALDGSTLVLGYRSADSYAFEAFPPKTVSLDLASVLRGFGLRLPALSLLFQRNRRFARRFATRIFSGVAAPLAAPKGEGVNIFYCHTPPRFLYDQREHFLGRHGWPKRVAARALMLWFEPQYLEAISRMDLILTNSENTRTRIRHYLGRDSIVVPPPVDTDHFTWRGQGDYYLSTARLTPLKRVERIVESFKEMPDKRLIIASGGEDLGKLQKMAADAPNITFLGWVTDKELLNLVGNAIATVYLPRDEDFGMSPVESMAAGKPVIGVAEGGLLETIIPDQTGVLLDPAFTTADLVKAIKDMTPEKAASMRMACEERAQLFSRDRFIAGMKAVIEEAMPVHDIA